MLKCVEEYIDVGMVEAIIAENNGLEIKWLRELLESPIKILNTTGRYIKKDRFIALLNNA